MKQYRPNGTLQTATNEDLAHTAAPPIQLRIDAAVTAVKYIITQAQNVAATTQNIKFGLYTMIDGPGLLTPTVNTVATPSTNYTSLQAAAATIDLGDATAVGDGETNYPSEFSTFTTMLTTAGVLTRSRGQSA